jgi:hypothetical protein
MPDTIAYPPRLRPGPDKPTVGNGAELPGRRADAVAL